MVAVGFSLLAIMVAVGTMVRTRGLKEKAATNIQSMLEEHQEILELELEETLSEASAIEERIEKAGKRTERLDRLFRQRAEMAKRMHDDVETLSQNCQALKKRTVSARGGTSLY